MDTTYGIISDIHAAHPRDVIHALRILTQRLGAEKLILNGDLVGDRCPGFNPQDYLATILNAAISLGVEIYAQAGSHEEIARTQPVFDFFSSQAGNFRDVCKDPVVDGVGHRLLFLPGSDWHAADSRNGLYLIDEQPPTVESGFYQTQHGPIRLTNIADVVKYTRDPERTIVVSHIPRAFDGSIETATDMAYFAERADKSLMPGVVVEQMIKRQFGDSLSEADILLIAAQNGFTMKRENRGNKSLRAAFEEAGITKAISGHFHESAHRAHDRNVQPLPEGQYRDELFWMASYADAGKYGILRVNDEGEVSYLNVNLRS
ncbi:metallophosphoesterase [Candidatus Woesearchaeota archaeon]|nr:metallophosphoesterase [Candidatus Woesearchaeota archaeon]